MLTYKITQTGYRIFKDDNLLFIQEGAFAKAYPGNTMEERAQAHLDSLEDSPTERELASTRGEALSALGIELEGDPVEAARLLRKRCEAIVEAGKKLATVEEIDSTAIVDAMALLDEYTPEGVNGDYKHEIDEVCVKDQQVWKCLKGYNAKKNPGIVPGMAATNWMQLHTTDPSKAQPFVQPTDENDSYLQGECVLWTDGEVYENHKTNNMLSPEEAPDDWEKLENVEAANIEYVSPASIFPAREEL